MSCEFAGGGARKLSLIIAIVLVANVAAWGWQDQGKPTTPAQSEPMALEKSTVTTKTETTETTKTETVTTSGTDDGFWFWPQPAPLTGPIVTDRPGFSDSVSLVPRGHVQIESGYQYTYNNENDLRVRDNTFPQLAFRTGLTNWLELRIQWPGYSVADVHNDNFETPAGRQISHDTHPQSAYDMNFGFKIPVIKQEDKCRPSISVIPSLYVPSGSGDTKAGDVVPELKFPWNYAINPCWSIYGSVLGRVPDTNEGQFFQSAATLAASYQVIECMSIYLEYFGVYPANQHQDCSHMLSGGPVFKITDNFSIDTRASVGLNSEAPDFQASIGFGIRF